MEDKILQEIQEEIKRRAGSYTAEWRFETENPDIGTALALAYAEMMAGTAKKLSKLMQKNRIAFLNELGVDLLPAVPSQGYAQFSLLNEEVEGSFLAAGTSVIANDSELPDGQAVLETNEDLYVTPAEVSDIYQACDSQDSIYRLYDREKMEWKPVTLFASGGENLQKHEMYFSHDILFHIGSEAFIEISFCMAGEPQKRAWLMGRLADSEKAVFEYYSEKGWIPFADKNLSGERLVFYKNREQPQFERITINGQESYWVRLRILDFLSVSELYLEGLRLSTWNHAMLPDTIFGAQEECSLYQYFPFGEKFGLYQEVYFGSEEVLSKKGAQIIFSFGIDFKKIPVDAVEKEQIQWDWIMKRNDINQEAEFDITIESVVWEYYNGSGWTGLLEEEDSRSIFSVGDRAKGRIRTLQFTCPSDIEKTLINAVETYYIRARILKINNLYKLTGNYISPFLKHTSFQYQYPKAGTEPQKLVFCNNLESFCREGSALKKNRLFRPFFQTGTESMGIYFGFAVPPVGSPVRILFSVTGKGQRQYPVWEYLDGRGWKNLNPVDETGHLSGTGILAFEGKEDMGKKCLFGKERYWFRLLDRGNFYTNDDVRADCPVLLKVYMNTTKVSGSGFCTNLEAGKISRLDGSAGYISKVTNPFALTGGCKEETPEQAMQRFSYKIRHQDRAVSVRDYEDILLCEFRDIQMVKCFVGYDDKGKRVNGAVTLVVLQKQFCKEQMYFASLKERILQYIRDKVSIPMAGNGKLFIIQPEFIEIGLSIELSVENYNQVFPVKKEMTERLEVFFSPACGQGMGQEIGSFPSMVQIQNVICDVAGVVCIHNIVMNAHTACRGEADTEEIKKHGYFLPVNGTHEITAHVINGKDGKDAAGY